MKTVVLKRRQTHWHLILSFSAISTAILVMSSTKSSQRSQFLRSQTACALVPLSELFGYAIAMRSMTQGRATYTMELSKYAQVPRDIQTEILETVNGVKRRLLMIFCLSSCRTRSKSSNDHVQIEQRLTLAGLL